MESQDDDGHARSSRGRHQRKSASDSDIEPVHPDSVDLQMAALHDTRKRLKSQGRLGQKKSQKSSVGSATFSPFKPGANTIDNKRGVQTSTPNNKYAKNMPGERVGEPKPSRNGPRKIDPDLITYSRGPLNSGQTTLPHGAASDTAGRSNQNGHYIGDDRAQNSISSRLSRAPQETPKIDDGRPFSKHEPFPPNDRMPGSYPDPYRPGPSQRTPQLNLALTSRGGDSSSLDRPTHNHTRSYSQSSHGPIPLGESSRHPRSSLERQSPPEIEVVSRPDISNHHPKRQPTPGRRAFGAHAREGNGHQTRSRVGREQGRQSSSLSPIKRGRRLSNHQTPKPDSPPQIGLTIHDDDEVEDIEDSDKFSATMDHDDFEVISTGHPQEINRKGKARAAASETPADRPTSRPESLRKDKLSYQELDDDPMITSRILPLSQSAQKIKPGTVQQHVGRIESRSWDQKWGAGDDDSDWVPRTGPAEHDLPKRVASGSRSPDKPINGATVKQRSRGTSREKQGLIPPSLARLDKEPKRPYVAGISRAWMYVNKDHDLPLALKVLYASIEGQKLVLAAGRGAESGYIPVDLMEISRAKTKILSRDTQSLLEIDVAFGDRRAFLSFIELTRPGDSASQYPEQEFPLVLQFEENAVGAVALLNFFRRWAVPVKQEEMSDDYAARLLSINLSDQGSTRISKRKSVVDAARDSQAGPSRLSPRPNARGVKRADVEELKSRSKSKPKKPDDRDPTQTTLSFTTESSKPNKKETLVPIRRSGRKSGGQPNYAEPEDASDVPKESTVKPLPAAERNVLLFDYPLDARPLVQITKGERHRVDNGDFLNDTLIEFGLRQALGDMTKESQENVYLFNSFFYGKISDKKQKAKKLDPDSDGDTPTWPGYESVKKWTRKADVFNKDFLIIPINEEYHWYLAIIYRPSGILQKRPNTPPPSNDKSSPARDVLAESREPSPAVTRSKDTPAAPNESTESSEEGRVDASMSLPARLEADSSFDPIDSLRVNNDDEVMPYEGQDVHTAYQDMKRLSLDHPEQTPSNPAGPKVDADGDFKMAEEKAEEKPEEKPSTPSKPDLKILEGNECWIFTFDSLGGSHRAVATHLNQWLEYEARDKGVLTHSRPSPGKYVEAKVPQQPNFSDCGLFLVHYAKQLLGNPSEVLSFIQRPAPMFKSPKRAPWEEDMKRIWNEDETKNLRRAWRDLIDVITVQYKESRGIKSLEPPKAEVEDTAKSAPPEVPSTQESVTMVQDPPAVPPPATRGASADPRPSTRSPIDRHHALPATTALDRIQRRSVEPVNSRRQSSVPITKSEAVVPSQSDLLDPALYSQHSQSKVVLVNSEEDMRDRIARRSRSVSRPRTNRSPLLDPALFPSPKAPSLQTVDEAQADTVSPAESTSKTDDTDSTSSRWGYRRQEGQNDTAPQVPADENESPFQDLGSVHDSQRESSKRVFITSPDHASATDNAGRYFHPSPTRGYASGYTTAEALVGTADDDNVIVVDDDTETLPPTTDPEEEEREPIEDMSPDKTARESLPPRTRASTQAGHQRGSSPLSSPPASSLPLSGQDTFQRHDSLPRTSIKRTPTTYKSTTARKRGRKDETSGDYATPTNPKNGKAPKWTHDKDRRTREEDQLVPASQPDETDELDETEEEKEPKSTLSKQAGAKPGPRYNTRYGKSKDDAIEVDSNPEEDK